jgi:hypothetical protein
MPKAPASRAKTLQRTYAQWVLRSARMRGELSTIALQLMPIGNRS